MSTPQENDAVQPTVQPTVVCFGETMGMFTPTSSVPLNTAEAFTLGTGGAESNVAMHLAELGHQVAWASALGTDAIGSKIVDVLTAGGVDLRWVDRRSDLRKPAFRTCDLP